MKHGTIRHPKLLALATALDMRPFEALGLLEALLDWTYDYAIRGDVGRFSDADIAQGIGYPGDATRLIASLVATRWLDRCATVRLVVHDLNEHATWTWKRSLQRRELEFARPAPPRLDTGAPLTNRGAPLSNRGAPMVDPSASASAPTSASTSTSDLSLASLACASTTEFDEFWKAYPRHVDKQKARKAWAKLRPPPLKAILEALAWQRELPEWRKEHGGFVPYPATYLNGRRWEDEPPEPQLFGVTTRTAGNAEAIKKGLGL